MRPVRRARAGGPRAGAFTLLEVLVSLAIFALAAVVLSAAYLNVLSSYQAAARHRQRAEEWQFVRAAVLAEPDRAVVERGGTIALPDGETANWRAQVEPTGLADLFAVTIRTGGGDDDADEGTRVERVMLLRPAWSDPGERDRLRAASRARRAEGGVP